MRKIILMLRSVSRGSSVLRTVCRAALQIYSADDDHGIEADTVEPEEDRPSSMRALHEVLLEFHRTRYSTSPATFRSRLCTTSGIGII
jgi:hypothetical protein